MVVDIQVEITPLWNHLVRIDIHFSQFMVSSFMDPILTHIKKQNNVISLVWYFIVTEDTSIAHTRTYGHVQTQK